jgi:hypothetical protein
MIPVSQNARQRQALQNPAMRKTGVAKTYGRTYGCRNSMRGVADLQILRAGSWIWTKKWPLAGPLHDKEAREGGIMEGDAMCHSDKRNAEMGREYIPRRGLKSLRPLFCA